MDDQPTNPPEAPETTGDAYVNPVADRAARVLSADEAHPTRYAVYDNTLRQYVGPVTENKPTSSAARKLVRQGHDFTIREV